jgi:hypothetical protein
VEVSFVHSMPFREPSESLSDPPPPQHRKRKGFAAPDKRRFQPRVRTRNDRMAALERFPVRIVTEADEFIPNDGGGSSDATDIDAADGAGSEPAIANSIEESPDAEASMLVNRDFDAQEYVSRYARVLTDDTLGKGLAAAHYKHFQTGIAQRRKMQQIASTTEFTPRPIRDARGELAALRSALLDVLDRQTVADAMLVRLTGILVDQDQHIQRLQREKTTWFGGLWCWFSRRG